MKIHFSITNTPDERQTTYIIVYVEGKLTILIDDVLFFNQPGIPLIEFGIFIKNWLNEAAKGVFADFIYESMDHDEPIISITQDGNMYRIDSIWKEGDAKPLLLKEHIIKGFENYLLDLKNNLKKYNIELETVFNKLD